MYFLEILLIGIGLSIDSFAASVSSGACIGKLKLKHIIKISLFMAFFQGAFTFIGWFIGLKSKSYIEGFDHWIAFALLLFIGIKMISEGFFQKKDEEKCFCPSNTLVITLLSIATSIDALVIGVGFGVLNINIIKPIVVIALTTLIFSASGVSIGNKIKRKIPFNLEIIGGIILICLGVKILLEHIYY